MARKANLDLPFGKAMDDYNDWLKEWVTVDEGALTEKRTRMAESDFAFLRATYFRWIQEWLAATAKAGTRSVYAAPAVLSVGDIHLENFGIWRDHDGRLTWGVNDFDEACELPYTQDLLRLAVSVRLGSRADATEDGAVLGLDIATSLPAILAGYQATMAAGYGAANPIVLAEDNAWLRAIALAQVKDAGKFWKKERDPDKADLITAKAVPEEVYNALGVLWPDPLPEPAPDTIPDSPRALHWYRRRAGLGSLGRPRYALFGFWRGGLIAREAKALVPSAFYWASGKRPIRLHLGQALAKAVRAPDPFLKVVDQWLVRRIAPDCIKLETVKLDTDNQKRMLHEMGREIANVHLGAAPDVVARIVEDLERRTRRNADWFATASETLANAVRKDRATLLRSAPRRKLRTG